MTFRASLVLSLAVVATACADDTLRAQTPQTTTGPYNTGTTATPGLSAGKADHATESGSGTLGPIAPANGAAAPATPTPIGPAP
jgi:hypothetical protein